MHCMRNLNFTDAVCFHKCAICRNELVIEWLKFNEQMIVLDNVRWRTIVKTEVVGGGVVCIWEWNERPCCRPTFHPTYLCHCPRGVSVEVCGNAFACPLGLLCRYCTNHVSAVRSVANFCIPFAAVARQFHGVSVHRPESLRFPEGK